jgi:hypothetical protein
MLAFSRSSCLEVALQLQELPVAEAPLIRNLTLFDFNYFNAGGPKF